MDTDEQREPLPFERGQGCTCRQIAIERAWDGKLANLHHEDGCEYPARIAVSQIKNVIQHISNTAGMVRQLHSELVPADYPALHAAVASLISATGYTGLSQQCACGCDQPVTSTRPEAKYATGACRVRAHRAKTTAGHKLSDDRLAELGCGLTPELAEEYKAEWAALAQRREAVLGSDAHHRFVAALRFLDDLANS